MKKIIISSAILFIAVVTAKAQDIKEVVEPLSKKSAKGYMYDITKDESGSIHITYKTKGDKKSEEVFYEEYTFDKDLKFVNAKDVQEKKEQKEDVTRTYFQAYVGGSSSFDVLSMKMKLSKVVQLNTWDHEKQKYVVKKTISRETVKPRNDDGKVYYGYASYSSTDETKSDIVAIAKVESKDKKIADKFLFLTMNDQLEVKEEPMELNGSYSLVFCDHLTNDDVVAVFAPNKGAADVSAYVYFQFDIEGKLKNRVEFKSPSSALLLTAAYENGGNVYFFGTSPKTKDPFEEVFKEYAPIYNPGSNADGNNLKDIKWRKSLDEKMENFHLLKFSGNQLAFASTTPVSEFKSKFKPAPGDKDASPYKGKRFSIENFFVTANEDYLIAGQLMGRISMGTGNKVDSYEDMVCFQFDKTGNLKAQYGVGKLNTDKKSEIFEMMQNFYLAADGKSVYWVILEVKGVKGYEGFIDAYNGVPTFYALFFPRVGKIDLSNSSVSAIKTLGNEKYFLRRYFTSMFDKTENSVTYFGSDDDQKNLWIGKMIMQ